MHDLAPSRSWNIINGYRCQTAVRKGDWNLVEANGSKGKLLFNLRDDIGQTKDLSAAHPERVRELQAVRDEWNKSNVPPGWKGKAKAED